MSQFFQVVDGWFTSTRRNSVKLASGHEGPIVGSGDLCSDNRSHKGTTMTRYMSPTIVPSLLVLPCAHGLRNALSV
jgi:hypothetical protein